MSRRWYALGLLAALSAPLPSAAQQGPSREPPMRLEAKIPLGEVRGRIDHLAVDMARGRLFVAELGDEE